MTTEHVVQGTDDQRPRHSERQRRLRIAFLYLVAGALIAAVLYPILCSFPKDHVGDGSEYYAMEMAVSLEHRPYVQAETWNAYERLRESGEIRSMQPADALKARLSAPDHQRRLGFQPFLVLSGRGGGRWTGGKAGGSVA